MKNTIPVKKNSIYKLTATGLSKEGHGIGKIDGFTIFCPGLLPGETAEVLVIKVLSSYAIGKTSEIIERGKLAVLQNCSLELTESWLCMELFRVFGGNL